MAMYKSDYWNCLSPINKAHLLERKADNCVRQENYEEAIALHAEAAELLQVVLKHAKTASINEHVLASLKAQIQYHRKQDRLVILRKQQKEMRVQEKKLQALTIMKTSQEPFQHLVTCSTTSLDSYDSTDFNSNSSNSALNLMQEHLNKRDEIIKNLSLLVKQQQAQILVLSKKLKEKSDENQRLHARLEDVSMTTDEFPL